MANIGDRLTSPELTWQRVDDTDPKITYVNMIVSTYSSFYNGNFHHVNDYTKPATVEFFFYGTKLRLYDQLYSNRNKYTTITIDETLTEPCTGYSPTNHSSGQYLYYEKTGLSKKIHHITLNFIGSESNLGGAFVLDCIDIDEDGRMCTKEEYELQEAKNKLFPVRVGDDTITSEENIAHYCETLTNGERQLLVSDKLKGIYLTDGQGGYVNLNKESTDINLPTDEEIDNMVNEVINNVFA